MEFLWNVTDLPHAVPNNQLKLFVAYINLFIFGSKISDLGHRSVWKCFTYSFRQTI